MMMWNLLCYGLTTCSRMAHCICTEIGGIVFMGWEGEGRTVDTMTAYSAVL